MNVYLATLLLASIAAVAMAVPASDVNLERGVEALVQLLSGEDVGVIIYSYI